MMTKVDRYLNMKLKYGRNARLGFCERIALYHSGKVDALHHLPKEDIDGEWISPFIQKELNACNETHNRIYGTLQLLMEDKYRNANEIALRIEYLEAEIEKNKKDMSEKPGHDGVIHRKYGEEMLTDSQVERRRKLEYEKEAQLVKTKIEKQEKEIEGLFKALIKIKSYLEQKNIEADLTCMRIRSHTQQRIDYYWSIAAQVSYDDRRCMPVTFGMLPIPNVVKRYKKLYSAQEERISRVINCYKVNKEAAYNG